MGKARPVLLAGTGVAIAALVTGGLLAAGLKLDPTRGQIRGLAAIGVWPRIGFDVVEPAGFEGVLVRRDNPAVILRIPAGKWTLPPPGPYRVFLEGKQLVSAYPSNLEWLHQPFPGRGVAMTKACVPAGIVRLDAPCASNSCRAWVLHETSNIQSPEPFFGPEMLREPPLPTARQRGVLMPAGRVITAVYDTKRMSFTAVSAPMQLGRGQTAVVRALAPKTGRAALILELGRPLVLEKRPQDDLGMVLVGQNGTTTKPAFITRTHNRVYAVWPDVPAEIVRVEVTSAMVQLPQKELRLRSGAVEYVARPLAQIPRKR